MYSQETLKELFTALGLQDTDFVTNINIELPGGDLGRVTVEMYVDDKKLKKLVPVLKRFNLVEKKQNKEASQEILNRDQEEPEEMEFTPLNPKRRNQA